MGVGGDGEREREKLLLVSGQSGFTARYAKHLLNASLPAV